MNNKVFVSAVAAIAAAVSVGSFALNAAPTAGVNAGGNQQGMGLPTTQRAAVLGQAVPVKITNVDNAFLIGSKIVSGACPVGEAGFLALKARGVKTILSVDGERPEVELARKAGLRYVHIPIDYSGMTRAQELAIARAVRDLPGPIFIHCHHGMHRGPSAAVIAAIANENWTNDQAVAALKQAGLAPVYTGLWANARNFKKPTKAELDHADNRFPSAVALRPYSQTMVGIDERWSLLKDARQAGWKAPAAHPDFDVAQQATLQNEDFRELLRTPGVQKRSTDFKTRMATAIDLTAALDAAVRAKNNAKADEAYDAMDKTCNSCHALYRNPSRF